MFRKEFLTNPDYPAHFIYGGLFLLFLRSLLQRVVGNFLNEVILLVCVLLIIVGFCIRFYQAKQNNTLKQFFGSIAFGLTMVIGLMVTGIIHTPAFLQDLF